jgi:predicted phage-related endonuclease
MSDSKRRAFIGGSDARIIMGDDEAALVRLWREKRGEAEPEDLSGNLILNTEFAGLLHKMALFGPLSDLMLR